MNLGQIVGRNGAVDYERVPGESQGTAHAPITVREWDGHRREHQVLYEGCMRIEDMARLGSRAQSVVPRPRVGETEELEG